MAVEMFDTLDKRHPEETFTIDFGKYMECITLDIMVRSSLLYMRKKWTRVDAHADPLFFCNDSNENGSLALKQYAI